MRNPAFIEWQIINNFKILKKIESVRYTNVTSARWEVECLLCKNNTKITTSAVKKNNSCWCTRYLNKRKPLWSWRKTPEGTNVDVNILISIYKKNAKKRWIDFNLWYSEFEELINKECIYCWDKNENILKKKGYMDFYYTWIDRIWNEKWYVTWNVVPCCSFCNKAKNNNSKEYFLNKILKINKCIEKDENYFNIWTQRVLSS